MIYRDNKFQYRPALAYVSNKKIIKVGVAYVCIICISKDLNKELAWALDMYVASGY